MTRLELRNRLNKLSRPKFCCDGIDWEYREHPPWDGVYVPTKSVIRSELCRECNTIHDKWYWFFHDKIRELTNVPSM